MASCSAPAPTPHARPLCQTWDFPACRCIKELCLHRQVVAPGLRLGWVTAAPAVIQKLVFHLHGISLGACSYTQASVHAPCPTLPAYPMIGTLLD